jgi:PAS domain S-box-containing protein
MADGPSSRVPGAAPIPDYDLRGMRRGAVNGSATARRPPEQQLVAAAFDRAPIAMAVIDTDGAWVRVSDAYCRMLAYRREDLLAQLASDLIHPDDRVGDLEWSRRARAGESSSLEREQRYLAGDGSIVWLDARSEMLLDDGGRPLCTVSVVQDITLARGADQATSEREALLLSIVEHLRGAVSVKDRHHRYQLVNPAFERRFGAQGGRSLGRFDHEVLPPGMLALDRAGDARVLRTGKVIEQEETVRVGGEDHVFLTVKFPIRRDDEPTHGVCAIANDITDRKHHEEDVRERLEWTERIHSAIAQDRLVLYGQPIVNLASGKTERAELLVRMRTSKGSSDLILPAEFLPAAERFDVIGAIDLWVVLQALELACSGRRVEVNLSGQTISDPEQVDAIERLVKESGAPAENIVFEITESAVAKNMESARRFAERLRALGCAFALDDFGVGFGTFTYLKHLPIDYLKIDIAFVGDLVRDESDRQVVHAIVGVARNFGMKTIAEGVENQETADLLRLIGVDHAQGYWLGRPAPLHELWPTTT